MAARTVMRVAGRRWSARAVSSGYRHGVGAVRRYGWLLADQAVFAVTNLIINLLFAHWLTPVEYGRFALTFSGFILLSVLHWYVVVEPLLVESARIRPGQVRAYVLTLVRAHAMMLAAAGAVSAAAVLVAQRWGDPAVGWDVAASIGGGSALLTLAMARRLCLAFLSAAVSAAIGLCYLVATVATAAALWAADDVTWWTLWLVLAGWSVVCAGAICPLLLRHAGRGEPYGLRDLGRAASRYAAWGSVAAGFSWIRSDGIFVVLAMSTGLQAVAQTRAIMMLSAPVVQINSALNASWLIDFGRCRASGRDVRTVLRYRALLYAAAGLLAIAATVAVAGPVTHLAYGGRYDAGAALLPLFFAACVLAGVEAMVTSAMKASGVFRDSYLPQIVGSVTVGATALALMKLGPLGAALAIGAGALSGLATAVALCWRRPPHD